jgi:DNA invertase Pin-like site-specific DNA recombinase
MQINVAIYARSSCDCPVSAEDQIELLKTVAVEHGWTACQTFVDRPTVLRKGRERRPGEDAMLNMIRRGGIQKVLLCSVDRIGRSLSDLVAIIETCRIAGVGLYLHDREMDTAGSKGLSMFDVAQMMAFHLRQSRRERILRGQAAARNASVRFGRPPISVIKVDKARQFLAEGNGVRQVARMAGISAASVSRLKADLQSRSAAD